MPLDFFYTYFCAIVTVNLRRFSQSDNIPIIRYNKRENSSRHFPFIDACIEIVSNSSEFYAVRFLSPSIFNCGVSTVSAGKKP